MRLTGELLHVDRAIRVLTHRLCQDTPNVCLTLETVMVNGCKRLTDRGLHVVAQCCPELRRLEVAGCYNISNDAVFEVVSRCPNLEHLNLSGTFHIPLQAIKAILPRCHGRLTHFYEGTCVALPQRIPHLSLSQSELVKSLEEEEKLCQP